MAETNNKAILTIGGIIADVICHVPSLPDSGQGIVATSRALTMGGCPFNSANVIRQLGQPYYCFAPIGRGMFADFISSELSNHGMQAFKVDTSLDCGACVCMIEPSGERTLLTLPGVDRHFKAEWFDSLNPADFASVLIYGYEVEGPGGDAIIAFAEQNPALDLVYAPGPRICGVGAEKTGRINALKPLWHINDLEALTYTGAATIKEAGQMILEQGASALIVTEGAKGAHFFSASDQLFVPTQAVEPVDTVGAGDIHIGTIMAARNAGHDWQSALTLANQVASALCCIPGATFTDAQFAKLGVAL